MESWYVLNKIKDNVTIDINEEIGFWGVTANSFINEVRELEPESLHLNMASLGGDLTDALTIYDFLKTFKGTTTGRFTGPSASSMTVIAMGLDKVEASENTPILIHNPWTMTIGSADEHRKEADNLDKFENAIVNIYKKRTGQRASAVRNLMKEDKWIDAKEAKSFGLIDKIVEPENAQNKVTSTIMNKVRDKNFPAIPIKFQNLNKSKMENGETQEKEVKSFADRVLDLLKPKSEVKAEVSDEQITEVADAIKAELEPKLTDLQSKVSDLTDSNAEKDKELEANKAEIAKYKAKGTVTQSSGDVIKTSDKEVLEHSTLAEWQLKGNLTRKLGLKN